MEELLETLLEMGELLLRCGAETYRVEDTLRRVGASFGAQQAEVFATPPGLFLSLAGPDGIRTGLRRVRVRGTDLGLLTELGNLSYQAVAHQITLRDLNGRLSALRVAPSPYTMWARLLAGALGSAGFSWLIGARLWDLSAAFVAGGLVAAIMTLAGNEFPQQLLGSVVGGFVAGLIGALCAHLFHLNAAIVVAAGVILLVPGLAVTSAVRDLLSGDLMAGAVRGLEALVLALAIATGVYVALALAGLQ